ncbi:hypothetical protein ACFS5M_02025 [Lacinutrix iliipiscaria]|uniref:Por secretion system C-terminal sorting domain-containing protein n=1 Tax=Lacinutrix iliipiscaria TaxID=1230532 RepID=A0ABW5WKR0_9FLAO
MKNLMKNTLVLVALFTALLGHANSSFNDVKEVRRTIITLNDVKKGDKLLIKDKHKVILYQETIKNSGIYNKGFDLSELPNGDYFFEVDKALEIKMIPFNVTNNDVVFNKEKQTIVYKPLIKNSGNKLFISKLSLNKMPLSIEVQYENKDHDDFGVIYSETIKDTKTIKRILNLSKEEKGTYKVIIKTEGRTFIDYIQY